MGMNKIKNYIKAKGVISTIFAVSSIVLITIGFLHNSLLHFAGATAFIFSWVMYYKEKKWS